MERRDSFLLAFNEELDRALAQGRPTLCTECLARPFGNELAAFLPVFAREKIGFYVWGLCEGCGNYRMPWGWPDGCRAVCRCCSPGMCPTFSPEVPGSWTGA